MKENLLVVGCGQYGIFVSEIAKTTNKFKRIDFIDDNNPLAIGKISEAKSLLNKYSSAIIAIGNPEIRSKLFFEFKDMGFKLPSIISPQAQVSPSALVSDGCVVEPMACIQSGAKLGFSSFVSSGAIIRHNAELGEFCHADCGSVVMSNSCVGSKNKIPVLTNFEDK